MSYTSNRFGLKNGVRSVEIIIAVSFIFSIVGCDGKDATCWSEVSIPVQSEQFSTIWGSSSGDVFAIGTSSRSGVVLHFNGSRWKELPFSGVDYEYYVAVWGIPDKYFFVKSSSPNNEGIIVEYDGQDWSETNMGVAGFFTDIWGSSENDIFVIGHDNVTFPGSTISRIVHFDGENWREMENDFTICLSSVWGSSRTDIFAVGENTILHYDGNDWSIMEENIPSSLNAVWGASEDIVFVAGSSGILRYNGSAWTKVSDIGSRYLWVSTNSDVFISGGSNPVRYSDGTNWISLCTIGYNIKQNVFLSYYGIWGASKNDVFVVGSKRHPESYSEGIILRSNFKDDLNCLCE